MDKKAIKKVMEDGFFNDDEERDGFLRDIDNINPNHYKQGMIEVIDFIEDQQMDYKEGNVIKYVSRYKYKNGLEDLLKAKWYLQRLIDANT